MTIGDLDSSNGYLVLYCCALHLGIQSDLLVKQDRLLSNTCFGLSDIFQLCAAKCPDLFGKETEMQKMFYLTPSARQKDHRAKFYAAMMETYRKVFAEHAQGW